MDDLPPRWLTWNSFKPLLRGIGQRPLLLAPGALIVLIASGGFGDFFGLPGLFWHQDWLKQALAGFAVALLFGEICLVGYLLDAGKPWLRNLPDAAPEGWRRKLAALADDVCQLLVPQPRGRSEGAEESGVEDGQQWRQLRWYVSTSWLPMLAVVAVLAVLGDDPHWDFVAGMGAALVVVGIFVWLFQHLNAAAWNARLLRLSTRLPQPFYTGLALIIALAGLLALAALVPQTRLAVVLLLGLWVGVAGAYAGAIRHGDAPPDQRWVHGLGTASFGLFFLAYNVVLLISLFAPVWGALLVPPAVALCLLLALIVAGHGFLKFHFGGWYTIIVALLVTMAVGVAGFSSYRHQLEGLNYDRAALLDLEGADTQVQAADIRDPALALTRLTGSYNRLYKRYDFLQASIEPDAKGKRVQRRVPATRAEAEVALRELRLVMKGLEVQRLQRWRAGLTAQGQRPKLAVVTVSGGANRSAVWTTSTLLKLERHLGKAGIPFPRHVRVVTGASGGMVGASYFTATLSGPVGHGSMTDAAADAFVRKAGQDALTPICQRLLFFDLPGVFVPGGTTQDRGATLEEAWKTYLDGALHIPFSQLAQGEAEGWRPSLIMSPMAIEDGRRILISNLYLGPLTETSGSYLTADGAELPGPRQPQRPLGKFRDWPRYSLTALEFFQMFPDSWPSFKLSTAARINASFPYVSPVASLPTTPPRHVVDAGYYDNYGVNLAAWWIYDNRQWLKDNTAGVIVIQLRDQYSDSKRLTTATENNHNRVWDLASGLQGIVGPVTGATSAIYSTMSFRGDEQLQVLGDIFNGEIAGPTPFFTTVTFACPEPIALSWYLSDQEIEDAMSGFEAGTENAAALVKLREWFKS